MTPGEKIRESLRVCASCEWIFQGKDACPRCGFGSYSAHSVYGKMAYVYKRNQKPWFTKKMEAYQHQLEKIIRGEDPHPGIKFGPIRRVDFGSKKRAYRDPEE